MKGSSITASQNAKRAQLQNFNYIDGKDFLFKWERKDFNYILIVDDILKHFFKTFIRINIVILY